MQPVDAALLATRPGFLMQSLLLLHSPLSGRAVLPLSSARLAEGLLSCWLFWVRVQGGNSLAP